MTKMRLFRSASFALVAGAIGGASALAGPFHPCDDRMAFSRVAPVVVQPVVVQPLIVQSVIAQPVLVQPVAAVSAGAISVPASADAAIRQSWAAESTRVSTVSSPAVVPGYRAAWADSGRTVVIAPAPVITSPDIIVVPDNAIVAQDNAFIEPLGAHDRLVVLNEFTRPGYDGRSLLYRDSTGLLHERTLYGGSDIFYDHLGRRCRYDRAGSMVVVLDDRVVRDYNHNGVGDDDRYVDPHRRAELQFHRDSTYRPIGTPYRPQNDWRDRYRPGGFRSDDRGIASDRTPSLRADDRTGDVRHVSSERSVNRAVNGRLRDDSRLTGNERKSTRSAERPKR